MTPTIYPVSVHSPVRPACRRTLDLDGEGSLRLDPDGDGAAQGWAEGREPFELRMPVPGCINALPELADAYPSHTTANGYEGGAWVRRAFELPPDWKAERTWLLFGGIMPAANVWVNGRHVGSHALSPIAFKVDATEAMQPGANVLTVELPWRDLGLRGGLVFGTGLWRGIELEGTATVHIEDLFIRPLFREQRIAVSATLCNDGAAARRIDLHAAAQPWRGDEDGFEAQAPTVAVPAGRSVPVEFSVPMPGARLWAPHDPFLYVLTLEARDNGQGVDAVAERFGMREIAVGKESLLLNGEPLMLRAACDEFFGCPTIAPILNPTLIRRRIEALQQLGFNAKRYHTHVPPREELDLCDELGLLVHAEISVISNFNRTEPYPACREVWKAALRQIRNHASLATYCMGNEGSQIMDGKYDFVREYYADAKALAPETPVLAASGMQGEHPDVPNDYETPHFWARFFKWSYDGLASVPTDTLELLAAKGPLVIHEYGKFTVWPDPAEDRYFRDAQMPLKGNYGAMGRLALEEAGLVELLPRLIRNSRALAAVCTKIAIEQVRRLPRVSGYHWLSPTRLNGNRGMMDDLARHVDPEFHDFSQVNAPSALALDRGFWGRTLVTGQRVTVTLYLSHFETLPLAGGRLSWRLDAEGHTAAEGVVEDLAFPAGRNGTLADVAFQTPATTGALTLAADLTVKGRTVAQNQWRFWAFSAPDGHRVTRVLCDVERDGMDLDLMAAWHGIRRLDDAVSLWRGDRICKTPSEHDARDYLSVLPPDRLVSDRWTDALSTYLERGGSVLLLDTGRFPEAWYAPREARDKAYGADIPYDMYTLFTPFRAGWDHGNAATVIEPHAAVQGFPHAGFCDLQCFAMVQGARSLRTAALPGAVDPIVRVIPIWKQTGPQAGPSPEQPDVPRPYQTENRVYLAACRVGAGQALICSLRLFADPAGRFLLDRLLRA